MAVEPVQVVGYKVKVNADPEITLPEVNPVNREAPAAEVQKDPVGGAVSVERWGWPGFVGCDFKWVALYVP